MKGKGLLDLRALRSSKIQTNQSDYSARHMFWNRIQTYGNIQEGAPNEMWEI